MMSNCIKKTYMYKHINWIIFVNNFSQQIVLINDKSRRNNANLPGMGGVFNHINCDLYHYAGNNPVKYTDPDGRFDIEEFYTNIKKLFSDRESKYSEFQDYKFKDFIDYETFDFYNKNPDQLEKDEVILYRATKNGFEYCRASLTEFGKMSKDQKLNFILGEYNKSVTEYENNKSDLKDIFVNLGYGTGEALFNIAQNSSIEDFICNYIMNNFENIGDLANSDIAACNILLDLSFLKKKYNFVNNNY